MSGARALWMLTLQIQRTAGGRLPINNGETAAAMLWETLTLGGSGARSGSARPPPRRLPPTWRTGECKGNNTRGQKWEAAVLGHHAWAGDMGICAFCNGPGCQRGAPCAAQVHLSEPDPNAHGMCCLEGLPTDRLGR
jgi:hypothetical protein